MPLVTTQEAKQQLHIDTNAHDAWLDMMIPAVEDAVIRWVGDESRVYEDSSLTVPVPSAKLAVLVEVAYQFRYREGPEEGQGTEWFKTGYVLNKGSTGVLQPLRKPRVA